MSEDATGTQAERDDLFTWSRELAGVRVEAQRRMAVRRWRRQAFPALLAGSAALAGLGVAVAWVDTRMRVAAPAAAVAPIPQPDQSGDVVALAALQRQLAAEEQQLAVLSSQAAGAAQAPAVTASNGSVPALGSGSTGSTPAPTWRPAAAAPVARSATPAPAPAVHATTGASHAKP